MRKIYNNNTNPIISFQSGYNITKKIATQILIHSLYHLDDSCLGTVSPGQQRGYPRWLWLTSTLILTD